MRRTDRFPVPGLIAVAEAVGWNAMASTYLSKISDRIIVCPMTSPGRGHYMEADASIVTSFDSDSAVIGQAVWEALLLFRSAPNLGSPKKRDWPAYRASGAKSVRAFEDQFVRVSVEAFPCVLRLEAVVLCRAANELFVGGFISNACEFNELGALIYQVSRSAIYVMEQEFG